MVALLTAVNRDPSGNGRPGMFFRPMGFCKTTLWAAILKSHCSFAAIRTSAGLVLYAL